MSKRVFFEALKYTTPVMCGYLFMGFAFGILLQNAGYNFLWALLMSIVIYAGTMQYMAIPFLFLGTNLATVAITTFLVHFRHFVYGLSFIDKFKKMGKIKPFMMFSLTDETYALLCSAKTPEGENENTFFFLIALLDYVYWITGCTTGAFVGSFLTFNTTGIDFVMTALFIVICVDQWKNAKTKIPIIIGLVCTILSLFIVGPDNMLIPSIISIIIVFIITKKQISSKIFSKDVKAEET